MRRSLPDNGGEQRDVGPVVGGGVKNGGIFTIQLSLIATSNLIWPNRPPKSHKTHHSLITGRGVIAGKNGKAEINGGGVITIIQDTH